MLKKKQGDLVLHTTLHGRIQQHRNYASVSICYNAYSFKKKILEISIERSLHALN